MRWGWIGAVSFAVFAICVVYLIARYLSNDPSSKPVVDLAFLALAGMIASVIGLIAGRSSARR